MKDPALLDHSDDLNLAAFAAMMLGASPLEPSATASQIATMASRLAEPRPARPGDGEATRALRSVYTLSREHEPETPAAAERSPILRWAVLHEVLRLRHRQRAALTLRYVLGVPPAVVARVLGVSKPRAREIAESGAARVHRAFGRRVDVGRHLRSIGSTLRAPAVAEPPAATAEPRSVFKLLISTLTEVPTERGRPAAPEAPAPRPVYNVRRPITGEPAPALPAAPAVPRKQRRIGLAIAACVAALTFLGAFAPAALLAPSSRPPLAAIPIAPVVEDARAAVPAPSEAFAVVVRAGDTLWSIAGRALGDQRRWGELWRMNAERVMADGSRFLDPDLIRPGWRLRLPPR